jgi:NAD-dependent SIR2 family protein deacetylase
MHAVMPPASIDRILEWLDASPRVLIGAGAGLSVAAGIDYTDRESFARLYPGMRRRGFRACYELIGRHDLPPAAFWGYWAVHVQEARFSPGVAPVYAALREITSSKDVFVVTSNVDAMFERHGFDADRVWTPQGDFAHMHCTTHRYPSCREHVWPSEPMIDRVLGCLDPVTQEVTDTTALPACPSCGGTVFFNVREDGTFVDAPYMDHSRRCTEWITNALASGPLLILEIGAGFNTPGVVRLPLERLAARHPNTRFVRINREYPEIPRAMRERAIGLDNDAGDVLLALRNYNLRL